jgi:hypothetical protein
MFLNSRFYRRADDPLLSSASKQKENKKGHRVSTLYCLIKPRTLKSQHDLDESFGFVLPFSKHLRATDRHFSDRRKRK